MIVKSFKSRSEQSRAMFLLSSQNFLQAYKRAQYMKQYASYRKTQGEEIQHKSVELIGHNEKLVVQKSEKQKLIAENEQEKQILEKEKQVQQEIAKSIKKDKKQIAAEIKKKQQESKNIDKQIDKVADAFTMVEKSIVAVVASTWTVPKKRLGNATARGSCRERASPCRSTPFCSLPVAASGAFPPAVALAWAAATAACSRCSSSKRSCRVKAAS